MFPFNVYLLAILGAFALAFGTTPLWEKLCLRIGLMDDPGHRKIHDRPVPLAGGLAVMTGLVVPTIVASLFLLLQGRLGKLAVLNPNSAFLLMHGLERRHTELIGILLGALGMLILGILDDRHELKPAMKFAGQFLIALAAAACGVRITLFIANPIFHYAVTILWILTIINAFNFMDNMNGLCTGLGAIGSWYFAIIAAGDGQYLVTIVAFLTFGALLGFLPYNFPRARAFLGDAGSHLVGYLLAVLAILPHFYTVRHPRHWAVLIPLLVLGIPLLDMVQVVIVRWRLGKPFYHGDTNHLSHRLVQFGLAKSTAVVVLWLASALLASLALLLN
jgi:UDP-GlcNAc:undecaprenyl-phosphate/decaprenyl-phosphate GlcNAc-1-phosphate transferase